MNVHIESRYVNCNKFMSWCLYGHGGSTPLALYSMDKELRQFLLELLCHFRHSGKVLLKISSVIFPASSLQKSLKSENVSGSLWEKKAQSCYCNDKGR